MFKPISQTRVAQRVVEQIVELVRSGRLKPGDRLPGENQLATEFRVSRPCVREALRILEAVGIVEVQRGKGCYVLGSPDGIDSGAIWRSWLSSFQGEVLALLEVREAVEAKVAALAAERASPSHLDELQGAVSRAWELWEAGRLGPDEAYALDVRFHEILARAAGNPFLLRLSTSVGGALEADRRATMDIPNRIWSSLGDHAAILEAVKRKDGAEAAEKMVVHIRAVARDISRATEAG